MRASKAFIHGGWLAFGLWLAGISGAWAAAPDANTSNPSQLVQQVAQNFLQDLQKNRDLYRKNSQALKQLVSQDLFPYFDTPYAARLVLGRHARTITPEQRDQFVKAFEGSMLSNYGRALVEFQPNRLTVTPAKSDPSATNAIVRTEIHKDDGSSVSVEYALHKTDGAWKAWDVIIQGISYVKSFRDDFGAQIDQQGIDAVIKRLQNGERPSDLAKQASGPAG